MLCKILILVNTCQAATITVQESSECFSTLVSSKILCLHVKNLLKTKYKTNLA